jgi:Tfp pilus assembly protein PilO
MNLSRDTIIALASIVGLAGLFLATLYLPGERRMRELRELLRSQQEAVQQHQQAVTEMVSLYQKIQTMSENVSCFDAAIPTRHDFGGAFRYLSVMIESAGLEERMIQPQRVYPLPLGTVSADLSMADGVVIVPLRIEFEGTIEQIYRFFVALEQWPRLTRLEQVRITRQESGARPSQPIKGTRSVGGSSLPRVRCAMVLHLFSLPRPEEVDVAAAAVMH